MSNRPHSKRDRFLHFLLVMLSHTWRSTKTASLATFWVTKETSDRWTLPHARRVFQPIFHP
ncbi:MAG: hypothetical protein KME27_31000 [Lyngbya sp. HA4199-MV5]|nr:hypothetical protein [Lyngbya sp. HA4199-MV5]